MTAETGTDLQAEALQAAAAKPYEMEAEERAIAEALAGIIADKLAPELAGRVATALHGGVLAIPAAVAESLKPYGGFYCNPMRVGYGPAPLDLQGLITHDGGLEFQLRDQMGQTVWRGQLRAEPASVPEPEDIDDQARVPAEGDSDGG